MKTSLILAHPNPQSFNHAIAQKVVEICQEISHEIYFHDLYEEKFNPVATNEETSGDNGIPKDIQIYCHELMQSDNIAIIHPNWWAQPPAILKGWIDRVLRFGLAYSFEGKKGEVGTPVGHLKNKSVVIFNTSNTPEEIEINEFGDPLEHLWNKCIFQFCGVERFYRRMFKKLLMSTEQQRLDWLVETKEIIKKHFV
jgi:NAD(P)H dehydrogenase (quinone)